MRHGRDANRTAVPREGGVSVNNEQDRKQIAEARLAIERASRILTLLEQSLPLGWKPDRKKCHGAQQVVMQSLGAAYNHVAAIVGCVDPDEFGLGEAEEVASVGAMTGGER